MLSYVIGVSSMLILFSVCTWQCCENRVRRFPDQLSKDQTEVLQRYRPLRLKRLIGVVPAIVVLVVAWLAAGQGVVTWPETAMNIASAVICLGALLMLLDAIDQMILANELRVTWM